MAKGQQKSNKEKRKPKKDKATPPAQTSTFSSGGAPNVGKKR